MKKRIISIALIVAMVVAMIPAAALSVFAAPSTGYLDGYDAYYSETDPNLDGVMDDVYLNSEAVRPGYTTGASFTAYYVVTSTGIYLCADVKDSTIDMGEANNENPNDGDYVKPYLQISHTANGETKWYYQKYFYYDYAHSLGTGGYGEARSTFTDGGYTIEIYMPWTIYSSCVDTFSLENTTIYVGIQLDTGNGEAWDNLFATGYYSEGSYGVNAETGEPDSKMIKLNYVTSDTEEKTEYHTFVTEKEITLDGECDEIYLLSEKITSKHISTGTYGVDTGFDAYIVGRNDGFYIFASIYDDTFYKFDGDYQVKYGDKFQVYLELGNSKYTKWGYVYFDYVDGGRSSINNKGGINAEAGVQQKAVIWEDQKGWDIEIFIPHDISQDDDFIAGVNSASWKNLVMNVSFHAENWGFEGEEFVNYGIAYDTAAATNASEGPSAYAPVDFNINHVTHPGTGAIVYATDASKNSGKKPASYGGSGLAIAIDKDSHYFGDFTYDREGKAWVAVNGSQIFVYALVKDTDNVGGSVTLYTYFPLSGYRTAVGNKYSSWVGSDTCANTYIGSGNVGSTTTTDYTYMIVDELVTDDVATSGMEYAVNADGTLKDGWYVTMFCFDLPEAEKVAFASGDTIQLGIGLMRNTGDKYIFSAHNLAWWENSAYDLPMYEVSMNSTAANLTVAEPKINAANVALGESITVNYYATLNDYSGVAVMKFTMNGKTTYVQGTPTGNKNEYKFAFGGIAPQCMGDTIDATLYVDGVEVDSKIGYSVKSNVTSDDVYTEENKALVDALLIYGAAAQKYTNYKADDLVADLDSFELGTIVDYTKSAYGELEGIRFYSAGVHYANVNKIFVKIETDDISKVKSLTVRVGDGDSVALELTEVEDGIYIAYTDAIKATGFNDIHTFIITDTNDNTRWLSYSVNAYAKAMQANYKNPNTVTLVEALYNYGREASKLVK